MRKNVSKADLGYSVQKELAQKQWFERRTLTIFREKSLARSAKAQAYVLVYLSGASSVFTSVA